MARGRTLLELVGQLKVECGLSSSVAVGLDKLPEFKQLLYRTQETLWAKYTWPHLMRFPTLTLAAGQRYYDVPAGLTYEGLIDIANLSTGSPVPMDRGIGFDEYTIYDPEADARSDPATRWDVKDNNGAVQIEVWPLPVAAQSCRLRAQRALNPLTQDTHTADLDDVLIVLFAATEVLARAGSKDAERKASLASDRLSTLAGRVRGNRPPITLAGDMATARPRGHVTIRVAS